MTQYSIEQAYIDAFSATVHHLSEQEKSNLRGACRNEMIKAKSKYFDRVGSVETKPITGQYEPKEFIQPDHTRRKLITTTESVSLIVGEEDIEKILMDPKSIYAQKAAAAINRTIDDRIIKAAFATVVTGQEGGGTVDFATDGGQTIAAGSTGMNKAKIDKICQNWMENNFMGDDDRFLVLPPSGVIDLMNVEEFTNKDYIMAGLNDSLANGIGKIGGMYNLNLICQVGNPNTGKAELNNSNGIWDCIAFTRSSMIAGFLMDIDIRVNQQISLDLDPYSIDARISVGALRMEGPGVQKVQIKKTN